MRKLFTIATAFLVGSVGMAQTSGTGHIVTRPIQNVTALPRIVEEPSTPLMMRQGNGIQSTIPTYSTDAVTSQMIGTSANYFGYSNNGQKQSHIINGLNSVAVVFRNDPTASGAGNSGHLRYNISSNKGVTWASTLGANGNPGIGNINPTQLRLGRYPNCILFTDPAVGGTTADARVWATGAALNTSGSGWEGFLSTVVGPNVFTNITTPFIEQEEYVILQGPVFPQHMTERVPGEFWATLYSDVTTNDTMYVLKGTYDGTSQSILWAYNDKLIPAWNTAVDGAAHWSQPKVEFSPDGKNGYVVVLGDLVGGQDSAYVPIYWDYDESTDHFINGQELDIKQFPQLMQFINSWVDTANVSISVGTPTTAFNFDLSVDLFGHPHILCIVGPASSGVPTNVAAYSISSGFAMQVMDITKDYTGSWNMIKLWDQQTFREDLPSASAATSLDPSMNLARTDDGKYIFYTWSDTDTTGNPGNNANDAPNLKGRFYDVVNDMISPTIDWTYDDAIWVGNAQGPKTPDRVFETGNACPGRTFNVPTTVCDIPSGDPATVTNIFYYSDINYNCTDATLAPEWYYTCAMNPIASNVTVVEPSCGQSNGSVTSNPSGGVGNYSYVIMNAAGATVSITNTATGLAAGSYTVMVTDSFGCSTTDIIALNNSGAPLPIASNAIPPTCANDDNGSMTVCWTGGVNPVTVAWFANGNPVVGGVTTGNCNTNNALPAGSIVAVVTDANGCLATVSGSLTPPSALSLASSYSDITCKDSANGQIVLAVSGGTGNPTYSWSGPGNVSSNITNSASGLIAGTYIATVTSGGCSVIDTFIIVEPALQLMVTASTTVLNTDCSNYNGVICVGNITGGNPTGTYGYNWTGVSGTQNPYIPATPTTDCASQVPGGTYTVTVTDSKGCTATATVTMPGCQVGIQQSLNNVNAFRAYPNPTSTTLNVQMTLTNADDVQISLVNVAGQTVLSRNVSKASSINEQLNVANLAKGIYFLKVTTSEGSAADKIIIE